MHFCLNKQCQEGKEYNNGACMYSTAHPVLNKHKFAEPLTLRDLCQFQRQNGRAVPNCSVTEQYLIVSWVVFFIILLYKPVGASRKHRVWEPEETSVRNPAYSVWTRVWRGYTCIFKTKFTNRNSKQLSTNFTIVTLLIAAFVNCELRFIMCCCKQTESFTIFCATNTQIFENSRRQTFKVKCCEN